MRKQEITIYEMSKNVSIYEILEKVYKSECYCYYVHVQDYGLEFDFGSQEKMTEEELTELFETGYFTYSIKKCMGWDDEEE